MVTISWLNPPLEPFAQTIERLQSNYQTLVIKMNKETINWIVYIIVSVATAILTALLYGNELNKEISLIAGRDSFYS